MRTSRPSPKWTSENLTISTDPPHPPPGPRPGEMLPAAAPHAPFAPAEKVSLDNVIDPIG